MMIYKKSAVQLFEKHPCLYILAFGFVSAKITNKLVVSPTYPHIISPQWTVHSSLHYVTGYQSSKILTLNFCISTGSTYDKK